MLNESKFSMRRENSGRFLLKFARKKSEQLKDLSGENFSKKKLHIRGEGGL